MLWQKENKIKYKQRKFFSCIRPNMEGWLENTTKSSKLTANFQFKSKNSLENNFKLISNAKGIRLYNSTKIIIAEKQD